MKNVSFSVRYQGRAYKLSASRTNLFSSMEIWEVTARNKTFRLECNRPLLMKRNLEDNAWSWRLLEGFCPAPFQKAMENALEGAIRAGRGK